MARGDVVGGRKRPCLLLFVFQPFLAAVFAADSRGTAARARLFGCSACEVLAFFDIQPFVAAVFAQLAFAAMSEA